LWNEKKYLSLYKKSQVDPLIVKADLNHLTKVYTGGESDFLLFFENMGVTGIDWQG